MDELGRLLANSWGLRGKLGLARLEKNRVLLEFEFLDEAKRVLSSGKRSMGGLHLGLEHWSPRTDCREEEEIRNEAWVKIVGLPISLWDPTILRRVGEKCGGFIASDPRTEKLEELQWARILVKMNGESLPSVLEIGIEKDVYSLGLWWELKPSLRKAMVDSRETTERKSGEVRGDDSSRAGLHVEEESRTARLEALFLPVDGMGVQKSGLGQEVTANWA